jgi:hypothetical protein
MTAFNYIGRALTLEEFAAYVRAYNFGAIKPDSVCFHHTAVPGSSWADGNSTLVDNWDSGEAGMTLDQIVEKRLGRLAAARNYYRDTLRWSAGPHLFVDNLRIYLFTEMKDIGIHAKWGNSFHDATGRLHYSIGIEVVGDYTRVQWPIAVQRMVGGAVAILQKGLGTFALEYLYPTPESKPGRATKVVGGETVEYCPHPERLRWGGLFSHRDTNKSACPGNAITEPFYVGVCREQERALFAPQKPVTETLEGPERKRFEVTSPVAAFYQEHGGLLTFGYPLDHEFPGVDGQGETCGYLITEFAVIKRKPSQPAPWTVRLAPRAEAQIMADTWQRQMQPPQPA